MLLTSALVFGLLVGASFMLQGLGLGGSIPSLHTVAAGPGTQLGIDCSLGSSQAVPDPVTGIPGGDGTLDTSCTWVGDVDADGILDPLVSDNPAGLPAGTGGGFTAEVRVVGLTQTFNGFDIQLSYDTRYLDGVLIDQTGLLFGGSSTFTLPGSGIDRAAGSVRLAQVLLGPAASVADATLFRVRFDVVGVGSSMLDLHDDLVVIQSEPIAHSTQDGAFSSASFFDPSSTLNPDISWTFVPNPEVPGSKLNFTATATCTGCGALSYSWDTNSDGTSDATGAAPSIIPPTVTLTVNRVVLAVTDGTNSFTATRRLPLTVNVQGPSTVVVNTLQTWTGLWLGGIAPYTGNWRFCPGVGATANAVCAKPAPTVASTPGQTNSQLLSAGTGPGAYHFAGVYTDTLKITDTASAQIGPASVVTFTFPVEVTGSPAAFTVAVTNVAKANVNSPVTITATIAYNSGYTASFRSSSFDVTFDFGDGSNPVTLPKSGCSTAEPPASPCTASTDHTFTAAGPYNIKVKAQETAAAAVSKILESGSASITINGPGVPLCDTSAGGCDFTFSPTSSTEGKPVTFTATVNGGTTPYSFDWNFGDGSAHGTTNPVMHSFAAGPYTVTLTVTDSSSPVQSHQVTHSITVAQQIPQLAVTVSCGSATAGKPVTCTATATGGSGGNTFAWRVDGTVQSGETSSSFTTTFATKGTHTIRVDVTDSSQATANDQATVNVAGQPLQASFTFSPNNPGVGASVTFTATASGGTGPYTFDWNFGDGSAHGTTSPASHIYNTKSSGSGFIVTLTLHDGNGAQTTATHNVAVAGAPLTADFTVSETNPPTGTDVTFTATASGGTMPYTYSWNFGDGTTGSGASTTHSYATSGTKTVMLTVTDANQVSSSPVSHTIQVKVVTVPLCDASMGGCGFAFSPTSPTGGKPVTFTATVNGGTTPYSFDWNFGDGSAHGTTNPAVHSFVSGTYSVSVAISDSSSPVQHQTVTHSVTVVVQPTILGVTVSCGTATAGKPVTCTATAVGGTPGYAFKWTVDGTLQAGQAAPTFTTTFATKGSHTIRVDVTDSSQATANDQTTVSVASQPLQAGFIVDNSGPNVDELVTFTATATDGTSPYTFTWSFGDGTSSGTGNPVTHVYSTPGTKSITLTVKDANNVQVTVTHTVSVGAVAVPLCEASVGGCDFTISPTSPTVGEAVTFTATSNGGTPPYTFSWEFGDGSSGEGASTSHFYGTKGSFNVVLTIMDSAAATAHVAHSVTVAPRTLTVDLSFSPSSPVTGQSVTFRATVSGGTAPYDFSWTFGDGTSGSGNTVSHTYSNSGSFDVTLSVMDSNGATASRMRTVLVSTPSAIRTFLTFSAFDADNFENGTSELQVYANGVLVADVPAGINGLTGTGNYDPYDETSVDFGPFDITSQVTDGTNTLVFLNPLSSHSSTVTNVEIVQSDVVLLQSSRQRGISPDDSATLTFSSPPLVIDSFSVSPGIVFESEKRTFTAGFSGGVGPFRCTFSFGDGDKETVSATEGTCSASHTYWEVALRTATVRVRGANTSDDLRKSMPVVVEPQPGLTDEGLLWGSTVQTGSDETFTGTLVNPSSHTLLVRADVSVSTPDDEEDRFSSSSFLLGPGQTRADFAFSYTPSAGTGDYCFEARLKYGVDTSGNGLLEDSEVLGRRSEIEDCFTVVNATQGPLSVPIITGLGLVPTALKPLEKAKPRKKTLMSA